MECSGKSLADKLVWAARCITGCLSPALNTRIKYFYSCGKLPNLKSPRTFKEKLCKLKLENYNMNPLVKQCADKVLVRQYVEECGYVSILSRVYGIYERPEDIPWVELPSQFVIKHNIGYGSILVCEDKSQLNIDETVRQLKAWNKKQYWMPSSEYQYISDHKRFIVEERLDLAGRFDAPEDYKVYCCNGEPVCILCLGNRFGEGDMQGCFMTTDWQFLSTVKGGKYPLSFDRGSALRRPACLEQMVDSARVLSSRGEFPFVRVDFYVVVEGADERLVFGEMTFTPGTCTNVSEPDEGLDLAEML